MLLTNGVGRWWRTRRCKTRAAGATPARRTATLPTSSRPRAKRKTTQGRHRKVVHGRQHEAREATAPRRRWGKCQRLVYGGVARTGRSTKGGPQQALALDHRGNERGNANQDARRSSGAAANVAARCASQYVRFDCRRRFWPGTSGVDVTPLQECGAAGPRWLGRATLSYERARAPNPARGTICRPSANISPRPTEPETTEMTSGSTRRAYLMTVHCNFGITTRSGKH